MKILLAILLLLLVGCSTAKDEKRPTEFYELLHIGESVAAKTPTPMEDWPIEIC